MWLPEKTSSTKGIVSDQHPCCRVLNLSLHLCPGHSSCGLLLKSECWGPNADRVLRAEGPPAWTLGLKDSPVALLKPPQRPPRVLGSHLPSHCSHSPGSDLNGPQPRSQPFPAPSQFLSLAFLLIKCCMLNHLLASTSDSTQITADVCRIKQGKKKERNSMWGAQGTGPLNIGSKSAPSRENAKAVLLRDGHSWCVCG